MKADDLITLAKEEPDAVIERCRALIATEISAATRAVVLRARSIAERTNGDLTASIISAEQAINIAKGASLDAEAGLAWSTLGASLLHAGQLDQARHALETGRATLSGPDLLQAEMHLAGLHARAGEAELALALFGTVARSAQALGMIELAADALGNRGTFVAYSGQLDAAEQDLTKARDLFNSIDKPVASAQMVHNLGWVAGLDGKLQRALDLYAEADEALAGLDFYGDTVRLVDRAEAELSAGLFSDAALDAAEASKRFSQGGAHADEAEARLLAAHALLARGSHAEAASAASVAMGMFTTQGRPGWQAEAQLVLAQCDQTVEADTLFELAHELDGAGQQRLGTTARLLAAVRGSTSALALLPKRDELRLSDALLHDQITAGALVDKGQYRAALTFLSDRIEVSWEGLSAIAPTDVRAGIAAMFGSVRTTAIELAHRLGDPEAIFRLAEWGSPPMVAPGSVHSQESELVEAIAELRSAENALRAATREYMPARHLVNQARRHERRVTNLVRRRRTGVGEAAAIPPSIEDLRNQLGLATLCRFVEGPSGLSRIDVGASGIRFTSLGATELHIAHLKDFDQALERSLAGSASTRAEQMAVDRVTAALTSLDAFLLDGIDADDLVIVPTRPFTDLPWSNLPSRQGRNTTLVPAANMLNRGSRPGSSQRRPTIDIAAFAGPHLPYAQVEANAVVACYERGRSYVGSDATIANVLGAFGTATTVHVAAHGHLYMDQPLLSSLELADGGVTVRELQLVSPAPETVVLASCASARSNAAIGDQLIGAAGALLAAGSRHVVACPVALPDDADTTAAMVALHSGLAAGNGALRALQEARAMLTGRALRIADALVVFGGPLLR